MTSKANELISPNAYKPIRIYSTDDKITVFWELDCESSELDTSIHSEEFPICIGGNTFQIKLVVENIKHEEMISPILCMISNRNDSKEKLLITGYLCTDNIPYQLGDLPISNCESVLHDGKVGGGSRFIVTFESYPQKDRVIFDTL